MSLLLSSKKSPFLAFDTLFQVKTPRRSVPKKEYQKYHFLGNVLFKGLPDLSKKYPWGPLRRFCDINEFDPSEIFTSLNDVSLPPGNVEYHMNIIEKADRSKLSDCVKALNSFLVAISWALGHSEEIKSKSGTWAVRDTASILLKEMSRTVNYLTGFSLLGEPTWDPVHLLCIPEGPFSLSPLANAYLLGKNTGDNRAYLLLKGCLLKCQGYSMMNGGITFDFLFFTLLLGDSKETVDMLEVMINQIIDCPALRTVFRGCTILELACIMSYHPLVSSLIATPGIEGSEIEPSAAVCCYLNSLRGKSEIAKAFIMACKPEDQKEVLLSVCAADNLKVLKEVLSHESFNPEIICLTELIDHMDGGQNELFEAVLNCPGVENYFEKLSGLLHPQSSEEGACQDPGELILSEDHPIFMAVKAGDDKKLLAMLKWKPFCNWKKIKNTAGHSVLLDIMVCKKPLPEALTFAMNFVDDSEVKRTYPKYGNLSFLEVAKQFNRSWSTGHLLSLSFTFRE